MAYDEELAARVKEILEESVALSERKMFGGIAYMVHGHMCCGVVKGDLMLRLDPEVAEEALSDENVRQSEATLRRPLQTLSGIWADRTRKPIF
jgi:TfoX/Sxy family transcriptional regulator of competence genes